ncbi:hypothetical protein PQS31_07870 [Luteimonas sp BLCC-B24]|uniref:hypothetical protein n=1 Tax=Luteimonas sp. BLCC-B24 TaxID=3025317 RepID=UPI00234E3711|nr:hypothetical protein [Luteimonas sp. BLCC-B24]MDC7806733.1 hypothetical protein [Luteimonas sp. BLCC-B24]
MTISAFVLTVIVVWVLVLFISLHEDRWPHAKRLSAALVGVTGMVIACFVLVGTYDDMISGRSVDITRAGSRSVSRAESQPVKFWISIMGKFIGGAVIMFVGAKIIKEDVFKK